MNEAPMTLPQRKALVGMLEQNQWSECLWRRVKNRYDRARSILLARLTRELAIEKGADKLVAEITQLKGKLQKAEDDLKLSGFGFDSSGDLTLGDAAPDSWGERLEEQVRKGLNVSMDDISKQFEAATLKLWAVPTADEACKIVEELQNIEVSK